MRRARPLLGTIVEITVDGAEHVLESGIHEAFAAIARVHELMSFHDATSDVTRINTAPAGRSISVDPHTYSVIAFAHELSQLSDGAFDITTASVLVQNGFLPDTWPGMATPHSTFRDLELLADCCVRWRQKGCIDLGGIAKGYAVDCAIFALRCEGITTAIVNAGGDLGCFGEPQPIHVRHPEAPTALMYLGKLVDGAFATSAGYFSGFETDEFRIDPIVDPKQRVCVNWDGSISVAAANCMTADALTKIIRLDPEIAPRVLEKFEARAFVVNTQGIRSCGRSWFQEDVLDGEYATASHALESNA